MPIHIRRRFLQVGARRVHYLRAGDGPPVVLIHSSPANAWFLRPEIEFLAANWTVFAFDTPGFGSSEPLPLETMAVADLADSMAETLDAAAMPPCPVFGSHSGAAIALELAVRHPERVTGVVLDGVPAFTDEECEAFFGDYFRKLPVSDLGGHYSDVWTRFRDQSTWFPWSHRHPDHLNGYDLSSPQGTHLWASMYFEAAETYTPAYQATSHYGARAISAVAELQRPAIFTATTTDMLYPHMSRFPVLKPGQDIREIGTSHRARHALIAEGFARFGSSLSVPADRNALSASSIVSRQFIDGPDDGQIHLRHAGDPANPLLLLIHDAPGSASALEPLMLVLAEQHFVVAADLPGHGESDRFEEGRPTLDRFVRAAVSVLDHSVARPAQIVGFGFGTSVAVQLAHDRPDLVSGVVMAGLLGGPVPDRAALSRNYTPPIAIEADGAHWYRTWLMLRDSLIWWPWYERTKAAQRPTPQNFNGPRLHRWTLEVMRCRETYGCLVKAALDHNATALIDALCMPVCLVAGATSPLSIYDADLVARHPALNVVTVDNRGEANAIIEALRTLEVASIP